MVNSQHWDPGAGGLMIDGGWRRFQNGVDVGPGEPPITHKAFAAHYTTCVAAGTFTDRVNAFARQRLGKEILEEGDHRKVIEMLVAGKEIEPERAEHAFLVLEQEDFITWRLNHQPWRDRR